MPKGDNFKKGAKDYIDPETARERGKLGGKVGGKAQVPKGFSHVDVQAKAQLSRQLNAEGGDDKEQETASEETEA